MFPYLSQNNLGNKNSADAIFSGKTIHWGSGRNPSFPYFNHLLFFQFGIWIFAAKISSALFIHIPNIVRLGSKKQMTRVAAGWVIAGMANIKPNWYLSIMDCIRKSMRFYRGSFARKQPIAVAVDRCAPYPTDSKSNILKRTIKSDNIFCCTIDKTPGFVNGLSSSLHNLPYVELLAVSDATHIVDGVLFSPNDRTFAT